jgi:hypothetical protein
MSIAILPDVRVDSLASDDYLRVVWTSVESQMVFITIDEDSQFVDRDATSSAHYQVVSGRCKFNLSSPHIGRDDFMTPSTQTGHAGMHVLTPASTNLEVRVSNRSSTRPLKLMVVFSPPMYMPNYVCHDFTDFIDDADSSLYNDAVDSSESD